jgi:hypothetical protein
VLPVKNRDGDFDLVGAKPMLLWYVWIRLVDGAWHKIDDISKQLHIPRNAVDWAAKYLCDKGMAERGFEENEIRLHTGAKNRFEDAVKQLSGSSPPRL